MRALPILLLLTACDGGAIKLGDDSGDAPLEGDADGDGYVAVESGGDDCDDADFARNPGATEGWYDGVDQDCSGGSDYDQDGDGHDVAPDGDDCDDLDATVSPATPEVRDLADQDCDGLVDEDFVTAGAIVVTEVMHHPLAASDADGEWFELTNTDVASIDLVGWTISADDGDSVTVARSLVVPAGGRVVFGASDNTGLNGGVTVDYAYDRAQLSLSADDTLFVGVAGGTVFDVEWSSSWQNVDGRSLNLDPDHHAVVDARQSAYWCVATSPLGTGDYGTPGAVNDECTALDEDGDGWSIAEGDCDDDDASVSPGAADIWDGLDNDCSGGADDGDIGDVAVGSADGPTNGYLGVHAGLGLGDVTGDGNVDLLVGGAMLSGYKGAVYVISSEDHDDLSGAAEDEAYATVTGWTSGYFGATSPIAGDVTGDGVADLVVASGKGGGYGSFSGPALAVFAGGPGLAGDLDHGDADFTVSGDGTGAGSLGADRVLANLDLNGDGLADLVYGQPNVSDSGVYKGQVAVIDAASLAGGGSVADADLVLGGDAANDYLGMGLGGADVDGDGYDDLFVGAPGVDDYATNGGAWYQVEGGPTWASSGEVDDVEDRTISGAGTNTSVGFGAPAFGDLDRDGFLDMAFGAGDSALVFYALDDTSTNLDTSDRDLGITSSDGFGFTVNIGDLDGDGREDLLVGDPATSVSTGSTWYYTPGRDEGVVYVFDGPALGTGTADIDDAWATAAGETSGDLFGSVASGMADINGDGADDVLMSAPRAGANAAGRVYVLRGK